MAQQQAKAIPGRTSSDLRAGVAVRMATVGPAGRSRIAPGTAGSLVGVAIVALVQRLAQGRGTFEAIVAILIIIVYAAGVWSAGEAERYYGVTDPGAVVIDEVAGQMLALLPLLAWPRTGWIGFAAGFLLFRLFDVVKPFPARRAERLPGGWGIMTDDIVAGAYGAAALFLLGIVLR